MMLGGVRGVEIPVSQVDLPRIPAQNLHSPKKSRYKKKTMWLFPFTAHRHTAQHTCHIALSEHQPSASLRIRRMGSTCTVVRYAGYADQ